MKKKLLLIASMVLFLVCLLALSANAARVEDYDATFTLNESTTISQLFRRYTSETAYNTAWYYDNVPVQFLDENGNELKEVPMWEYDEEEGRYYSLVWYISERTFTKEKEDVTYNDVTTQRDKYLSAVYTLKSVRAVDLRFDTSYSENRSFKTSLVGYDYELSISKPLWGIFLDVNNTPNDTTDDLKLQGSTGMGRDNNDYGNIGYEAQADSIGNRIVVANFRDCDGDDFDADCTGNYGTKTTWYLADNLQCLWYHDGFKYMVGNIGGCYEIDLGDGIEVIACQLLRDNKRIKSLVLPNSLIYMNSEFFRGSVAETLVVGEGLLYAPTNVRLWGGPIKTYYISKNILNMQGYIAKYEGNGSPLLNSGSDMFFAGSLEEATSLMTRMISENSGYDGKITLVDYNTQQTRGDLKNTVIFYNYNRCDAFYRGVHDTQAINGCQEKCSRCETITLSATPDHANVFTQTFAGTRFFSSVNLSSVCEDCETVEFDETLSAPFNWVGYSAKTFGDAKGFGQQYVINQSALTRYMEIMASQGVTVTYGVVAAGTSSAGQPLEIVDGVVTDKAGAESICFNQIKYDAFFMNITGIDDANLDANLVCCAYVQLGEEIVYLDDNQAKDTAGFLTYNIVAGLPETKGDEE